MKLRYFYKSYLGLGVHPDFRPDRFIFQPPTILRRFAASNLFLKELSGLYQIFATRQELFLPILVSEFAISLPHIQLIVLPAPIAL